MVARKRALTISMIVLVIVYVAFVFSPLPKAVGRGHPEIASWFYPPFFNFSAEYDEGVVQGYRVGMMRNELSEMLTHGNAQQLEVTSPCGDQQSKSENASARESTREPQNDTSMVCVWIPSRRTSLVFTFEKDAVTKIRLSFVRNEVV